MKIIEENFGKSKSGKKVNKYIISNSKGMTVCLINYGASIQSLVVPDKNGNLDDVVLGFDTLEDYENHKYFSGAIVGRYANRISNGQFNLAGKSYSLACNIGEHHLHGGIEGFGKKIWEASTFSGEQAVGVTFSYFSPDGEENYSGNLTIQVTYTFQENGALTIDYYAETDEATPVNLTNHAYFNLKGAGAGDILDHDLMINAKYFTPVTQSVIPSGDIVSVKGTPFDFTQAKPIGRDIAEENEQLQRGGGYDHNFVLNNPNNGLNELGLVAKVVEPTSSRTLEILGSHPAVQLYTANFLDPEPKGKSGKVYQKRGAFCLETQHYPDSPNQHHFPSTIVHPEQPYKQTTVFKFGLA